MKRASLALCVVLAASPALAQDGRGFGGGWGGRGGQGGGGQGGGDQRAQFMEQMIARMDANQNGQLDPDETQGRARRFLERMAQDSGLDLSQPIKLDVLKQKMAERMGRPRGEGGAPGATPATSATPAAGDQKSAAPTGPPLVPAFGASVAGFGEPTITSGTVVASFNGRAAPVQDAAASPSGGGPGAAFGGAPAGPGAGFGGGMGAAPGGAPEAASPAGFLVPTAASSAPPPDEKVRGYVRGLMKNYDTNGDGILQKDEWATMKGKPQESDANGDGSITEDEMVARMGAPSGGAATGGAATKAASGPRKSYRYLRPSERLPGGLPGWFSQNDSDGDGQVQMAEYAATWTKDKAAEFKRLDRNGDGVVTPREALGN